MRCSYPARVFSLGEKRGLMLLFEREATCVLLYFMKVDETAGFRENVAVWKPPGSRFCPRSFKVLSSP